MDSDVAVDDRLVRGGGPTPGVDAFKDTRVNAKAGLTTTLYKSLSAGLGFLLKYDQNPAPRPLPTLPAGTPPMPTIVFGPNLGPFADRVDMQGEVTLEGLAAYVKSEVDDFVKDKISTKAEQRLWARASVFGNWNDPVSVMIATRAAVAMSGVQAAPRASIRRPTISPVAALVTSTKFASPNAVFVA